MTRGVGALVLAAGALLAACTGALGIEDVVLTHAQPAPADPVAKVLPSPASGDAGPTCSADLTSDPNHCGRCDRACGGAACENGRCAVRALNLPTAGYMLSVSAGRLYFSDEAKLYSCAIPSCAGGPIVEREPGYKISGYLRSDSLLVTAELATRGTGEIVSQKLYFKPDAATRTEVSVADWAGMGLWRGYLALSLKNPSGGVDVVRCDSPSCTARTQLGSVDAPWARLLGAGTSLLAYTERFFAPADPEVGTYASELWECATGGCKQIVRYRGDSDTDSSDVVTDGTTVYFNSIIAEPAGITACDLPGCTNRRRVLAERSARHFVLHDGYLYFTNGSRSTVNKCRASACTETLEVLADGEASPGSLAVGEGYVFWSVLGVPSGAPVRYVAR